MNVLFYGSCYPPCLYGASRYIDNLSRALVARGHGVTIVTHKVEGLPAQDEKEGGCIYRVVEEDQLGTRAGAQAALRIAANAGVDIIQGVEYLGECAAILRERDHPPVCIKAISSISMRVLRQSLAYGFLQAVLVHLACVRAWRQWRDELCCLRDADWLFTATRRVREELVRQGIVVPAHHGVVPNPVMIPEGWQNDEAKAPVLLFVGRLDFGKGVASLPGVLRAVRAIYPSTKLVLAGGDHYARGIGSIAAWLRERFGQDAGHVVMAGALGQAELNACYAQAWVVLVPSRWDSCSNVTLEAMARAKPLVVSPHGGMQELVDGCGVTVADPGDPSFAGGILELLSDAALRKAQGLRLHERALACYAPERIVEQYINFVEAGLHGIRERNKA